METHQTENYKNGRLRIRLLIGGSLVGLFSGLIAVFYRYTLGQIDGIRNFLFSDMTAAKGAGMLLAFFVLAFLMHRLLSWAPYSGGSGIPQIRGQLLGRAEIAPVPTLISKFFGGSMAALSGLTLGREGPSIQLGGTLAGLLADKAGVSHMESRYLVTAGASAGLAAAFNAPLAGALFALEEMHKSLSHYFVVPCIVSSVVANFVSFRLLGMEPAFSFPMERMLPVDFIWAPVAIGVLGGVFGVVFNKGLLAISARIKALSIPRYGVIFLAMALVFLFGLYNPLLLGGGHGLIESLADAPMAPRLLVLFFCIRLLLVWTGYGSGAQGGIFLPVLTLGALLGAFGHFVLPIDDIYYANFLYLGMAAILSSVIQAPLLSILLVSEMSGTMLQMISVTTAAMVAYLIAQILKSEPIYESLYDNMFAEDSRAGEPAYSMQYFLVPGDAPYIGIPLHRMHIPHHGMIASVQREGRIFTPNRDTTLEGGDEILLLIAEESLEAATEYFGGAP